MMDQTLQANHKRERTRHWLRDINDRLGNAAKESSEEALSTYERVMERIASALEGTGERAAEWITEASHAQARWTRRLADAVPTLLDRLRTYTREATETAQTKLREVPQAAYAEGSVRGAVARETDLAIANYDELTVQQINDKLPGLSLFDLGKIDAYEARTKDRKTVRDRIETLHNAARQKQ
jgi:hypothetical protein